MRKRLGEPVPREALAPRSVVDLNRKPLNLRKDFRVATLNTRTLKDAWRLEEACHLASKRSLDVLCVQEHRIAPTSHDQTAATRQLDGGWTFHFAPASGERAHGGVGVLLSPRLSLLVESAPVVVSSRLMQVKLHATPGSSLYVVCCYAPTAAADDAETEAFYSNLDGLLNAIPPDKTFIVCGDFNATLTERLSHVNVLPADAANNNSDIFAEFLLSRKLRPANFYQQPRRNAKLHTFVGPNDRRVCLDYILVPTRWIRSVRSVSVLHRTRLVPTDHRAVVANLKLRLRTPRRATSPFHLFDWSRLADEASCALFEQAVSARLAAAPTYADAETDPSGFSRLKKAIHVVAAELLPLQPRASATATRNLPAIQLGRGLAASLNVSPSQIMPDLYRRELEQQLTTLCRNIEDSFDGNQTGLAFKAISSIAGTSWRRQPGLSGTPSEVKRNWELHFTHLFRQGDDRGHRSTGGTRTSTGADGGESMQITRSEQRGRLFRHAHVAAVRGAGDRPVALLGRFDAPNRCIESIGATDLRVRPCCRNSP